MRYFMITNSKEEVKVVVAEDNTETIDFAGDDNVSCIELEDDADIEDDVCNMDDCCPFDCLSCEECPRGRSI